MEKSRQGRVVDVAERGNDHVLLFVLGLCGLASADNSQVEIQPKFVSAGR